MSAGDMAALEQTALARMELSLGRAEAALRAAHSLGDGAVATAIPGIDVQDPIGLPVAERPQDDALGLDRTRHVRPLYFVK